MESSERPHAFITGASGFIGGHVVREFLGHGWRVSGLVHRTPLTVPEARGFAGDVGQEASLRRALDEATAAADRVPEVIVHAAGHASDVGRRALFERTQYDGLRHLGGWATERGVGRVVFVSTTDVYGLRDFSQAGEDDLSVCERPENPYPEIMGRAEGWLRARLGPGRFAIVRPGAVWGAGDPTLTPRFAAFLRTSPWIVHFGRWRGTNRWPLAHVKNVAAGIFLAATVPDMAGGTVHIVDSERTSVDDFFRLVARVHAPGKTFGRLFLPLWAGEGFGGAVTLLSNLLRRPRPLLDPSLYAVRAVAHDLDFDNTRFAALMARAGRSPVTREEGLREWKTAVNTPCPGRRPMPGLAPNGPAS